MNSTREQHAELSSRSHVSQTWFVILGISLTLQAIIGGIRFSDAGALAEIATNGFQASLGPQSQYLFDSLLKVALLHGLGIASPLGLALLFSVLTVLPLLLIVIIRNPEQRWRLAMLLACTPIAKVCFQNIGIGDSVTISLAMIAGISTSLPLALSATAILVFWHPQQGLVLGVFLSAIATASQPLINRRSITIAIVSMLSFMACQVIKNYLAPDISVDRIGYIRERFHEYGPRNLFFFPLVALAAFPGIMAALQFFPKVSFRQRLIPVLLLIPAFGISILAEDFSRLFIILSIPSMLALFQLSPSASAISARISIPALTTLLLFNATLPLFSWSGIDTYVWTDLVNDLSKYLPGLTK